MMRTRWATSVILLACLALLCACGPSPTGGSGDPSRPAGGSGDPTPPAGGSGDPTPPAGGSENPSQYQVAFTVGDGSSSRAYTWAAKYQNLGFYYDSYYGHYYNIFCAADGSVGELYTYKHVYLYLPNGAAGSYSSSDGITGLVYHDALGNRYGVDAYDSSTRLDVVVSIDDKGFLHGSFSGVLSSPNAYMGSAYVSVSGTVFSYFE